MLEAPLISHFGQDDAGYDQRSSDGLPTGETFSRPEVGGGRCKKRLGCQQQAGACGRCVALSPELQPEAETGRQETTVKHCRYSGFRYSADLTRAERRQPKTNPSQDNPQSGKRCHRIKRGKSARKNDMKGPGHGAYCSQCVSMIEIKIV